MEVESRYITRPDFVFVFLSKISIDIHVQEREKKCDKVIVVSLLSEHEVSLLICILNNL